jgi:hypothetical protein
MAFFLQPGVVHVVLHLGQSLLLPDFDLKALAHDSHERTFFLDI